MQEKTRYDSPPLRIRTFDPQDHATPDLLRLPSNFPLKSKSSNSSYIRTTFYLPKELHKRLKIAAAQKDRDMSGIIEELLESWFQADEAATNVLHANANNYS